MEHNIKMEIDLLDEVEAVQDFVSISSKARRNRFIQMVLRRGKSRPVLKSLLKRNPESERKDPIRKEYRYRGAAKRLIRSYIT